MLDFLCTLNYNKCVHRILKGRCLCLSPCTGRPKSDNPKNIQLKIRADKETIEDLDFCCVSKNMTRSDVIRLGIKKVKEDIGE